MKSKDIAIIVGVAIVSAIFSYVIAGFVFGGEDSENLSAPIVQTISTDFPVPAADDPYFNSTSLNPTRTINIGETDNNQPF